MHKTKRENRPTTTEHRVIQSIERKQSWQRLNLNFIPLREFVKIFNLKNTW